MENHNYAVGDVVDAADCGVLTHYPQIKEFLPDGRVVLHFKEPNQPDSCGACGAVGSLSENISTGEVVCQRTGCGHEHGFRERDAAVLQNALRENITRNKVEA